MNDIAVKTEGLGKRFGHHWAVRGFNLEIPKGTVFGLLGPNGAGKSTTIQMLMGLLPPNEGSASVLGVDPMRKGIEVRRRVGYVPEIHGFYDWMTVRELAGLVAAYHTNWSWTLYQELVKDFKLRDDSPIDTFSKGMRAKTALLLALSFDPEMLILDEPTGGLDPAARRNFIETILGRYQESGKTILVSSHLLNEFSGLLDYVGFIRDGQLEVVSKLEDLMKSVKRARLVFEDHVPSGLSVANSLAMRVNGREAAITCRDYHPSETRARLSQTGASQVIIEDMTLEDIFVDLVGS